MSNNTVTSSAASPIPLIEQQYIPAKASLPKLPNVLFELVTKTLKPSEADSLPLICRETRRLTNAIRSNAPHLNISYNPRRSPMNPDHLREALRLYPGFTSIDFSGYANMSIELRDILVEEFKRRPMKAVRADNLTFEYQFNKGSAWLDLLRSLNPNAPSTLEHLSLTGASTQDLGLVDAIHELVSSSSKLKTLRVPNLHPSFVYKTGAPLVKLLPSTLELLGPNWAPIDDELVTEITSESRFNRDAIKRCQLTFEDKPETATAGKRWELLRFLKLSEMSEISLQGANSHNGFEEWPANKPAKFKILSSDMVDHIAQELKENENLEVLELSGLIPSEDLVPSLVRLINTIESDQLRELTLLTTLDGIPDMTSIEEALRAKLPSWKKIEKIQINNITLDLLRPLSQAESSSSSASPLDKVTALLQADAAPEAAYQNAVNNLFRNFFSPAQSRMEQIRALDKIPIPTIFAHYAQAHNKLVPNKQILPSQVLAHFRNLTIENQNLNWNGSGQLIRLLENLFQREKKQVESEISHQINAEKDHEYAQAMGASVSSIPTQSSQASSLQLSPETPD